MPNPDVLIIGGGFLGLSTAYEAAKAGLRTLLLEANDLGSGTSGSCSGRAQVCEGHLDPLNIALVRDGVTRHERLAEELAFDYAWRRVSLLLLLRSERHRAQWLERSSYLTSAGIPTEVIDQAALREAEPNLQLDRVYGAVHSIEGRIDPLRFIHAYARAAVRAGAEVRRHEPVVAMQVEGNRIVSVQTPRASYAPGTVAVMAGAWETAVTRLAGVELPIRHAHAETYVTEPIPPRIFHNIGLSDSYETIHGKPKAVTIGIHPELNGTLAIAESVTRTPELHRRVSSWALSAISTDLVKLYPFLARVRVVRSWGRPTSFTPDEEPLVGWVPGLDNLFVATSLMETITVVPLLAEWMAGMLRGQQPPLGLDLYAPARFPGSAEQYWQAHAG
jgi:glycine/D-amino acid oxidase-like deaminating enzyme